MTTKGRKLPPEVGNPNDPDGLFVWARRFVEHERVRNYSEETIRLSEIGLRMFLAWAHDRSLERPSQITRPILEAYQRWLFYRRKPSGKPIASSSQRLTLQKLKGFFRYLARQHAILSNPAADLELPRMEKKLPRGVLTEREIEQVMALCDLTDAVGLRDRAMMEVFYSTGIRRHELARLRIEDIDRERETLFIKLGKGKKDRIVPIGERALFWVDRYLEEARPQLLMPPDEGILWISEHGGALTLDYYTRRMRDYVDQANLGKRGACHIFRHSMATQMLDAGCDIRHLQELLGHADMATTAIYTRVSVARLKAVHGQFHPAAKLEPKRTREPDTSTSSASTSTSTASAEDLLAALEAESTEDEASS